MPWTCQGRAFRSHQPTSQERTQPWFCTTWFCKTKRWRNQSLKIRRETILTHKYTRPCKNHAFPVEFWHVLVKQTAGIGFQRQRPQILSGYGRRFRLQFYTGNKEIFEDL
jgi:hypothetical protein